MVHLGLSLFKYQDLLFYFMPCVISFCRFALAKWPFSHSITYLTSDASTFLKLLGSQVGIRLVLDLITDHLEAIVRFFLATDSQYIIDNNNISLLGDLIWIRNYFGDTNETLVPKKYFTEFFVKSAYISSMALQNILC